MCVLLFDSGDDDAVGCVTVVVIAGIGDGVVVVYCSIGLYVIGCEGDVDGIDVGYIAVTWVRVGFGVVCGTRVYPVYGMYVGSGGVFGYACVGMVGSGVDGVGGVDVGNVGRVGNIIGWSMLVVVLWSILV